MKIAIRCCVLALAVGCGTSAPSRLYLLESLPRPAEEAAVPAADVLVLSVGPVGIAEYLDRPQIVTRGEPTEISAAEFDRWAEPLKESVPRVIAENLSVLLASENWAVFPGMGTGVADYRVGLAVMRFDGSLPGEAVLNATWLILEKGGANATSPRRAYLRKPIPEDGGYRALVTAQSELLAELSRAIAEAVKGLKKPGADQASE